MQHIPLTMSLCMLLAAAQIHAASTVTIYNQNFGVVRDQLRLDLKNGINDVLVTDITAHLEPDSVILRDPAGKRNLQILEQNYRADPVSQGLLLSIYEGKEIPFLQGTNVITGKIIRSGYVPHQSGMQRYGHDYRTRQMAYASPQAGGGQPIIEVDGLLRFSLPGLPLFPPLTDDPPVKPTLQWRMETDKPGPLNAEINYVLKPTLHWLLETDQPGPLNAEIAYVTGGMGWEADYNILAPEEGDLLEIVGWVTMDNQTGKTFQDAQVKLMAGDVNKIQPQDQDRMRREAMAAQVGSGMRPTVSQKDFDEYHLYTLNRTVTLRDRETKQVEFLRAAEVRSERLFVYDGALIDWNSYRGHSPENIRQDRAFGTLCNPKVWVMREFQNSETNNLGIPLPEGRVRFYRRDSDGLMEFTGENTIDHTPRNEIVRVYTGNAFDLIGSRKRTDYRIDTSQDWCDESFEISVRNRKQKEAVEIRVVEQLYRWVNWEIVEQSHPYVKIDSQTIEFRVQLAPDAEELITYKAHYTW
ncbi:MAG: hypothetical protein LC725_10710 [Lentisphaerae bacterium]|nr:hypothetical protein [Lentisphaerota bacterium]